VLLLTVGLVGGHHYYMKRRFFGVLYTITLGLFGLGWLIDFFRLPTFVSFANRRALLPNWIPEKRVSDVYALWFPLGIFGTYFFLFIF
jgi:hypothetical protein